MSGRGFRRPVYRRRFAPPALYEPCPLPPLTFVCMCRMGKTSLGRDDPRSWAGAYALVGHAGPAALLEAAALSERYLAVPKRTRPAGAVEGQSGPGVKRRRVSKSEGGNRETDPDGDPTPKSRFLGVHWNKCKKKWRVRIKIAGRDTHIGYYADEAEAALAFDW